MRSGYWRTDSGDRSFSTSRFHWPADSRGISREDRILICVDDSHKTTAKVLARKAFTVHVANAAQLVACDYVGVVSGNDAPYKLSKTGWHLKKSAFVYVYLKLGAKAGDAFKVGLAMK